MCPKEGSRRPTRQSPRRRGNKFQVTKPKVKARPPNGLSPTSSPARASAAPSAIPAPAVTASTVDRDARPVDPAAVNARRRPTPPTPWYLNKPATIVSRGGLPGKIRMVRFAIGVRTVFLGLGARASQHVGRTCQDLGNKCCLPRRAPGREGPNVCHWARDCPNRAALEARLRR